MSFQNPSDDEIRTFLQKMKHIAVVGLSPKPDRPSFGVAQVMQDAGYRIIPVHPGASEILGEKAWPDLASVPDAIDLVDVFRKAEDVDAVVDEAIRLKLPAIWIQLGIINEAAAERARAAGMFVVMDRCLKVEWRRLCA